MKKIRQGIGIVCLLINPALMYIIFEWITESLNQVQGIYIVLNLAIFYEVYLVIFALSNSMRISYVILNGVFTFWAMAEYFVVGFRERPIMLWDIMAFRTAMAVSANYQYIFTKKLIAIACFMLVWSGFLCFFPVRLPSWKQNWKARLVAVSTSIMASVVFFVMLFQVGFLKYGIEINMWEPVGSYAQYGYMLSTLKIVDYYRVEAPTGYSLQAIQDIQAQIEKIEETEELKTETKLETELKPENESSWKTDSKITPTNIICIMNES